MNSEFENQLQRQPLREIPPHWRGRIIDAAQIPARSWRDWLWPHPRAWAALGAGWLLIFVFHLASPEEPKFAGGPHPATPQSFASFEDQTKLMAELLAPNDFEEQPAALPASPKPRTEIDLREMVG